MSDINTAVMPFSKGHVGLCSAPAIRELTELAQPGWRNSQGVKQPWPGMAGQGPAALGQSHP